MLNIEKYKKELTDILMVGDIAIVDGEPKRCCDTQCKNCKWDSTECTWEKMMDWLLSEYVEPPKKIKLTKKQAALCEALNWTGYFRVLEENGGLVYTKVKPRSKTSILAYGVNDISIARLPFPSFDFIKEPGELYSLKEMKGWEVE